MIARAGKEVERAWELLQDPAVDSLLRRLPIKHIRIRLLEETAELADIRTLLFFNIVEHQPPITFRVRVRIGDKELEIPWLRHRMTIFGQNTDAVFDHCRTTTILDD